MRLIDADELSNVMYHQAFETDTDSQKWDSGCWIRYKMFENAITDAPTIDPVKHGRWIHEVDTGADMLKCSECSCRVVLYWYKLAVGTAGYEYCPYCGALMDEEG